MRLASTVVAAAALAGVAFSVFQWGPSVASSFSGGGAIDTNIISSTRLEATVSTDPGTTLSVSGPNGSTLDVRIPGTVTLSAESLAALNGRFCTPGGQGKEGVDGVVVGIPPIPGDGGTGALPGRTSISIDFPAQPGNVFLSCYASALDGGTDPVCTTPDAGFVTPGFRVDEGGGAEMEVSDAYVLRCRTCLSDGTPSISAATVSFIEMDCNQ